MRLTQGIITAAVLLLAGTLSGCQSETAGPQVASAEAGGEEHSEEAAGHDHGGWWCTEHGVPEEECAQCQTSLAAEFKAKGDWCDEHDRPESQCFKCHPENFEAFAARYEAKFGERPPQPEE